MDGHERIWTVCTTVDMNTGDASNDMCIRLVVKNRVRLG